MIGSITIVFWPPGVLTTWCTLNRFEHVKFLPKFKSQCQVNGTDNLFLVFDYLLSLTRLHRLFLRGIKSFRDLFRLSDDNPKNLFFFPAAPNRKYNKYAIEFEAPEAKMKDKQCNYCVLCKSLQKPWREGTNAYRSRTSPIATEGCFFEMETFVFFTAIVRNCGLHFLYVFLVASYKQSHKSRSCFAQREENVVTGSIKT